MKLKFIGESVLAIATISVITIALSSGLSNANDVAMPAEDAAPSVAAPMQAAGMPSAAPAVAISTQFHSASGEGMFNPNGDLVGGH